MKSVPILRLLCFALALGFTAESLTSFVLVWPYCDFGAFYESGLIFTQGKSFYVGRPSENLNPPHISALLFVPLTAFNWVQATGIWLITSAVLVAFTLLLLRQQFKDWPAEIWGIAAGVALAASPLQQTWRQGQIGAIWFFVTTCAWLAVKHQSKTAPWWLAAGISIKPWLIVLLVLAGWRTALLTCVIGVGAILLSLPIVGVDNWLAWQWATTLGAAWPQIGPANLSLWSWLVHVAGMPALWWIAAVSLVTATIYWRPAEFDAQWTCAIVVGILLSPIGWNYYLLALTGPLLSFGSRKGWPIPLLIGVVTWVVPLSWLIRLPLIAQSIYLWGGLLVWGQTLAWRSFSQPIQVAFRHGRPTEPPRS